MNTRIEVPFTLPPPHFDDDATIATARQVVPIKGARRIQGGRKLLTLVPLLIASTLCGALGAIAVNYFAQRRDTVGPLTQTQPQPNVSTQVKTEPPPVAIAPEVNAEDAEIQAALQPEGSAAAIADAPSTKSEEPKPAKRDEADPKSAPPAAAKREPIQDAAKLVRKRRVQPADSEIPVRRSRRSDASRIEDIFTGPNP